MKKQRVPAKISIGQRLASYILVILMLVPYGLPNVVYAVDDVSSTAAVSTSEGDSITSGEGSGSGEHASSSNDGDTAPDSGTDGTNTAPEDDQDAAQPDDNDETPGEDAQPGDGDETPGEDAQPDDGETPGENPQPEKPEQPELPEKQGGAAVSEKLLFEPLSLTSQSVTIENLYHGAVSDGYSATYTVTLTVDGAPYEGDYQIDSGAHAYAGPFSLSLGAGEEKMITLENDEVVLAEIRQTSVPGGSVLLNADEQSCAMDENDTLTFIYSSEQIFYVDVNWNDNRATDRPLRDDIELTLSQSADDGATYIPTSIDPIEAPIDPSSYNTWTYTYVVPAYDVNGDMLTYAVSQSAVANYRTDDAVKSIDAGGDTHYTIVNTRLIDLTFDVVWQDNENTYATRPGTTEYLAGLTLYRDGAALDRTADAAVYAALDVTVSDEKTWLVSFKDLSEYDANGMPYTYKTVQGAVTADNALLGGDIKYTPIYENKSNYATDVDGVYVGGCITNRLEGDTAFEGTKKWLDDGHQTRPDATLQIYRYPTAPDNSFESGSPVPIATIPLDKTAAPNTPIPILVDKYADAKPLERFDEDGVEYVYFAKETLSGSGNGNYTRVFKNNPDVSGKDKYMFNKGDIENLRTGTLSITATKKWVSLANQTLDKSVVLELEKKNRDTGEWESLEPARTVELNGFIAEISEKSGGFSCPEFDEMGLPIEYRVVEKSAIVGGKALEKVDATLSGNPGYNLPGSNLDWYTITTAPETANASEYTITNKLEGRVDLVIVKEWQPLPSDADMVTLTFDVYQNGGKMTTPTGSMTVVDAASDDPDIWSIRIPNLPKYDDNGVSYDYTVVEHGAPAGYSTSYSYDFDESNIEAEKEIIANVVNYIPGEAPSIYIEKKWLDDGDQSARRPVVIGLFRASDNEQLKTITLDAKCRWESWITIPSAEYTSGETFDADFYARFYVKELYAKVGSGESEPVNYYANTPAEIQNGTLGAVVANGPVTDLRGVLKTHEDLYQYIVTTEKNGGNNSYIITNRRFGTVNIPITKTWVDGNKARGPRPSITYTLTRDGAAYDSVTKIAADETADASYWNHTFSALPKYDVQGKLYVYRVSESFSGDSDVTKDYSGSATPGTYQVGLYHTDDELPYAVTNRLSGTVTQPKIHKIWMDDGTERRPDIYFRIYRSIGAETPTDIGYVEHRWSIETNNHWVCTFDSLPQYDGNGYEYNYFVREIMLLPGNYVDHYYQETPTGASFNADAYTELAKHSIGGKEVGLAPIEGTVVNRQEYVRDINGKKIWVNTVGQLALEDYPEATVKLYYMPYDEATQKPKTDPAEAVKVTADRDGAPIADAKIKNGATFFEFKNLPKYDALGRTIYYIIKEESIDGYAVAPPSALNFTLTNTYAPSNVKLRIALDKTFSGELLKDLPKENYPTVTLEFYRQMKKSDGAPIGGKVKHLVSGTSLTVTLRPTDWEADVTNPGFLHASTDEVEVPYWAPNGQPYDWFIKEAPVNGYTITAAGIDAGYIPVAMADGSGDTETLKLSDTISIKNEYIGVDAIGDVIKVKGTKTWVDDSNKYNTRPMDLTLTLQRRIQGEGDDKWAAMSRPAGVDAVNWPTWTKPDNTWGYEFSHASLVKYAPNGSMYEYQVVETPVTGYTAAAATVRATGTATEYTANFTNTLQTTKLSLVKNWKYAIDDTVVGDIPVSGNFGLRDSGTMLTFRLERSTDNVTFVTVQERKTPGGPLVDATRELSSIENYTAASPAEWAGLPSFNSSGSPYYYRAVEIDIGGHAVAGDKAGAYAITYSHTAVGEGDDAPKVSTSTVTNTTEAAKIYLQTEWDDVANQDGVRPGNVAYTVKNQNAQTAPVTQNKPANAAEITTLTEAEKQTHWPVRGVIVPKYLLDGTTPQVYSATQTTPANGQYTTSPEVVQSGATDYPPSPATPEGKLYAFKNTHTPQLLSLPVTKAWTLYGYTAYQPSSIELQLKKNKPAAGTDVGGPVTVTPSGGSWQHTFTNLPARYNGGYQNVVTVGTSEVITYSVSEVGTPKGIITPSAVTASHSGIVNNGSTTVSGKTITNRLDTVSYTVQKLWDDSNNLYKSRPVEADGSTKVRVALYRKIESGSYERAKGADGSTDLPVETLITPKTGTPVVSKTWSNLPKYDTAGKLYTYFAKEESIGPDGTSHAVTAFDINTLLGGEAYNYEVTYSAAGVSPQTVTNTVKAIDAATQITLTKVWDDNGPQDDVNNGQDGKRPTSINVTLFRDGVDTETVTLNRAGGWSHTFTDLPKYRNGSSTLLSDYTFKENATYDAGAGQWNDAPPAGYTLESSGFTNPEKTVWQISNKHEPLTMTVEAAKTWNDSTDAAHVRPISVELTLQARKSGTADAFVTVTKDQDGTTIAGCITVGATESWKTTWHNLPQYKEGTRLEYRVVETAVGGYSTTYTPATVIGTDVEGETKTVGVTNTIKLTNLTVEKLWQEPDGTPLSPEVALPSDATGVTVVLYRRLQDQDASAAVAVPQHNITAVQKLTATGGWTYTWNGLLAEDPDTGKAYVYDARETHINGITLNASESAAGFILHAEDNTVSNKTIITNRVNRGSIPVTKVWGDAYGFDLNVKHITVQLQRLNKATDIWEDVAGKTLNIPYGTATAQNFTGLQLQDLNGSAYEYRAIEKRLTLNDNTVVNALPDADPLSGRVGSYGYTAVVESAANTTTITNTLETASLTVKKEWDDNDDQDGARPTSLTVKLIRDGVDTGKTAVLNDANNWSYTFNSLPKYKNDGTGLSVYTFDEGTVANYNLDAARSGLSGTIYTLTNTYAPKTMTVEAIKVWSDGDNAAGVRPASVVLTLQVRKNGTTDAFVTVTKDQSGATINGVVTVGAAQSWKATWSNLAQYRDGTKLEYRVVETRVGGYAAVYAPESVTGSGSMGDKQTIEVTNTIIPTSFTVEKLWFDPGEALPANITVALYRTADGVEEQVDERDLTVADADSSDPNRWAYTWNGLLAESPAGTAYAYRAQEVKINGIALDANNSAAGYTRGSQTTVGPLTTVTNSVNRGSVGVSKSWVDYNYDMDVDHITVQLQRLNKTTGDWEDMSGETLDIPYNAAGAAAQFENIQLQALDGTAYEYRVLERRLTLKDSTVVNAAPDADPLNGALGAYRYTTSVTGNTTAITNTLEVISYPVEKQWDDNNNQDGVRPDSLAVNLLRDSAAFKAATLTDPDWSHTFVNLPKYQKGDGQSLSVYTVTEESIDNYIPGAHGLVGATYTLINSYAPKVMTVTAAKTWVDDNDAAGLRPASIALTLEARPVGSDSYVTVDQDQNGDPIDGVVTIGDAQGWTASWNNLPQRRNGRQLEYRVVEAPVADYITSYSVTSVQGTDVMSETKTVLITNTYIPRLKVDNATGNPGNRAKSDVGGKVAIVGATPPSTAPNEPDMLDYQDNALAVTWRADTYYQLSNSFTVSYRQSVAAAPVTLTVSGYLDERGSPKPISDPVYAALLAVYPHAGIEMLADGTVYLRLGNTPLSMPAYTAVDILFVPTLAVENTTAGNRGGMVQIENGAENNQSDGVPGQDGHNRYTETRVIGKSVSGYYVDVKNLTIGLPTTSNGDVGKGNLNAVKIQFDKDGRFTVNIPTVLNGVQTTVPVSGTVNLVGPAGSYTKVEIILDALDIPLDIGIPFAYLSDSGGGSEESIKPTTPEKPKDEVPEDVFWDNVGKLISTAKPGDVIKVKPGLFENLPPSIEGLLQTYPGITLELTYNDGRVKVLSAGSTRPNPSTGGIWEISAPGSISDITSGNVIAPSQEAVLTADHTAEPTLASATIAGETKQAPRAGFIGAALAAMLLLGSSGWYLTKRTYKRRTR